jgi:hypothetical protein
MKHAYLVPTTHTPGFLLSTVHATQDIMTILVGETQASTSEQVTPIQEIALRARLIPSLRMEVSVSTVAIATTATGDSQLLAMPAILAFNAQQILIRLRHSRQV